MWTLNVSNEQNKYLIIRRKKCSCTQFESQDQRIVTCIEENRAEETWYEHFLSLSKEKEEL